MIQHHPTRAVPSEEFSRIQRHSGNLLVVSFAPNCGSLRKRQTLNQYERRRTIKDVVIISGAGRRIGATTAHTLGRRGARVIINYRSDAESANTVTTVAPGAVNTAATSRILTPT